MTSDKNSVKIGDLIFVADTKNGIMERVEVIGISNIDVNYYITNQPKNSKIFWAKNQILKGSIFKTYQKTYNINKKI